MERISGSVERITYHNPENGYTVFRFNPETRSTTPPDRNLITVTGVFPDITPGEHFSLGGEWVTHPKHGKQFQAVEFEYISPESTTGIERYLGSGLIRGIGPGMAARIVGQFGDKTLEIINDDPERLRQVPDIGEKRLAMIQAAWTEQKHVQEIMVFLHRYKISTNLAIKIYKQYGTDSIQVVNTDPYQLANDIHGVGFKTSDRIAQSLGLPADHPSRLQTGMLFALNQAVEQGNVLLPVDVLLDSAQELLGVDRELLPPLLKELGDDSLVTVENLPDSAYQQQGHFPEDASSLGVIKSPVVYLPHFHIAETESAAKLREINSVKQSRLQDVTPSLFLFESDLTDEQQKAVQTALTSPLSVLTGGPGTGKTTTINILIQMLELGKKRFALASPTGRAANRLAMATNQSASTIHRLLGYKPGEGFSHNQDNPLNIDLLVIDEVSMMDLPLLHNLLDAIMPGTHLLLVGDVDQLPSVGPGNVLRDIIRSRICPVIRLTQIFRQAAGSEIIQNAHRINLGEFPDFSSSVESSASPSGDFYFFEAESPEIAATWIEDIVSNRIPQRFNLDRVKDIQVLSPMYRGPSGVDALNQLLQDRLNPATPGLAEKSLNGQIFRLRDKVMQTRNNYDLNVFNGDLGFVESIDQTNHTLRVNFEGNLVEYAWSDTDQLVLAYAISIHKSQGSEFPAIVIPMLTQQYIMLQRNLLYTAVTRAKRLCVLVGSKRAIHIAVNTQKISTRYSALSWRLQ